MNPTLAVHEGDVVQVTLINGEGAEHDIIFPDVHASSQRVAGPGASSTLVFHAMDIGFYPSGSGAEPVRDWLKDMPEADRRILGFDIALVELPARRNSTGFSTPKTTRRNSTPCSGPPPQ